MKLYFSPGACSLAVRIALTEAGLPFAADKVDLRTHRLADGTDYYAINPKGYVPLLELDDGQRLTEGPAILQYIGDQVPDQKLVAPWGSMERYRQMEWLNFIATELHKGMSPLYKVLAGDDFKKNIREVVIPHRLSTLAAAVKPYLMGAQFSVADAYAFYVLRSWIHHQKQTLDAWPTLVEYYQRLAQRPSVQKALAEEGITA